MGKNPASGMTVDKACKLLRAGQPFVWALAIIFGLLGVTLIVRYLWRKRPVPKKEQLASGEDIIWARM